MIENVKIVGRGGGGGGEGGGGGGGGGGGVPGPQRGSKREREKLRDIEAAGEIKAGGCEL